MPVRWNFPESSSARSTISRSFTEGDRRRADLSDPDRHLRGHEHRPPRQGQCVAAPLTHDLIVSVVENLGGEFQDVVISELKEHTYYRPAAGAARGRTGRDRRPAVRRHRRGGHLQSAAADLRQRGRAQRRAEGAIGGSCGVRTVGKPQACSSQSAVLDPSSVIRLPNPPTPSPHTIASANSSRNVASAFWPAGRRPPR